MMTNESICYLSCNIFFGLLKEHLSLFFLKKLLKKKNSASTLLRADNINE